MTMTNISIEERLQVKEKLMSFGCPEDIADAAALNSNNGARDALKNSYDYAGTPAEKVQEFCKDSFIWDTSPQGWNYWNDEVPLLVAAATEIQL